MVGLGAWFLFDSQHSIVNGGEIFVKVQAIRSAVPVDATDVRVRSTPASWIGGCPEIPGSRSGWTSDYVAVEFLDGQTRSEVVRQISHALARAGWLRHDESPGPHRGRLAHWTLNVQSAHLVQAWAFPVGPGGHHWYFSAAWRPPGPMGQGCP
ncbi:MAG: hypothetical protein WA786_01935 [Acidimicrobiales bacterium]